MQCQRFERHLNRARKPSLAPLGTLKALLLCAILLNIIGCAASPYRWTQLNQGNFPAKVNQIITEYGNLLDHRHRAGYGEWIVSTMSEPPVATYACPPGETCHIVVDRLHCANAQMEKTQCAVRLDVDKKICRLVLSERKQTLSIRCPLDVVLYREKTDSKSAATPYPSKHTTAAQF